MGFVGESKNASVSFQLLTKLFEKSEVRGIDASGFWGTETGHNGAVVYHKEPIRSSQFVKSEVWRNLENFCLNLLLVHARGASKGVGEPSINKNNHPFTSSDKSLALIHNGRVDDCEYRPLRQKYETKSECDSEILLRIIEGEGKDRLQGIKQVWSLINEGHMAVAVGERAKNGERHLWLFRNQFRPIWLADMREKLGQIFFFSEPSIWEEAVSELSSIRSYTKSQKLIELPHHQIWSFKLTGTEVEPADIQRLEVCKSEPKLWEYDEVRCGLVMEEPSFTVVTNLNEQDQIIRKPKVSVAGPVGEEIRLDLVNAKCDEMIDIINNIRQYAEQLVQESSLTQSEYQTLLNDLEQQRQDLVGISTIINR